MFAFGREYDGVARPSVSRLEQYGHEVVVLRDRRAEIRKTRDPCAVIGAQSDGDELAVVSGNGEGAVQRSEGAPKFQTGAGDDVAHRGRIAWPTRQREKNRYGDQDPFSEPATVETCRVRAIH